MAKNLKDREQIKKNIGFDLERELVEQSDKDWKVGGIGEVTSGLGDPVKGVVTAGYAWPNPVNGIYQKVSYSINHAFNLIRKLFWEYLPLGQVQRGKEDWMNCATNAPLNEDEKHHNYIYRNSLFPEITVKFLKEKGYINPETDKIELSNAFNSIRSGTTESGNSLKSPLESIRNDGVIPLSMLSDDQSMTWEQYHNPKRITQEMIDLGQEYKKYIQFNYSQISKSDFGKYLDFKWNDFDSYVDPVDGDYVKQLAPDYNFLSYGYLIFINNLKKNEEGENMIIEVEVKKQKNTPNYLLRDKKDPSIWHRIGDENTYNAIAGEFPPNIEETEIAQENISSPVYLISSFWKVLALALGDFLTKLKGRK
jgi:hypothetical protein